jgi:hypothetical protein
MAPMKEKEWTLMFYLASDNDLAPSFVSQLKAIKQAGFHQEANVVVQLDPQPENVGTHIFDVNRINKILARHDPRLEKKSKVGFLGFKPNDSYVVNLMNDKIWRNDEKEGAIRKLVIDSLRDTIKKRHDAAALKDFDFDDPPEPPPLKSDSEAKDAGNSDQSQANSDSTDPNEPDPQKSLASFLKFCSDNYPAKHYMLFIVGHGVVVGNDTFLFDEHSDGEQSLSLPALRDLLKTFTADIRLKNEDAQFELVSFHSCSMSSLEVAFELQDTANYMLASQSPAFIDSYPYRQILMRVFNCLDRGETDVPLLLKNIFHYCTYHCYDFLVAGYSGDLCLCNLRKVSEIKDPVSDLSVKLIDGLKDPRTRERILLAHLDAQSYFDENYTDLFDFCFCLLQRFEKDNLASPPALWAEITKECNRLMEILKRGVEGDDDRFIVRSEFVGPTYQYSHGMSVYFPWRIPIKNRFWPDKYKKYKFIEALPAGQTSWSDFLEAYFNDTRRETRRVEFKNMPKAPGAENEIITSQQVSTQDKLLEAFSAGLFNKGGQLQSPVKGDPGSSAGAACSCQSIKNYPPFTREPSPSETPVPRTALNDPSFRLNGQRSFVLDGLAE